jgi:hypothetical protein
MVIALMAPVRQCTPNVPDPLLGAARPLAVRSNHDCPVSNHGFATIAAASAGYAVAASVFDRAADAAGNGDPLARY